MRKVLHTYHEPISGFEIYYDEARLLEMWRDTWARYGWRTVVLTSADAERHPGWRDYLDAVGRLPTLNHRSFENHSYNRWMAMAAAGGGFMADSDVMPIRRWKPDTGQRLTVYSTDYMEGDEVCPCFVHGSTEQYEEICAHFASAAEWAGSWRHVSDQELLRARRIDYDLRRDVLTHGDPRLEREGKAVHLKNGAIESESGTKSERMATVLASPAYRRRARLPLLPDLRRRP